MAFDLRVAALLTLAACSKPPKQHALPTTTDAAIYLGNLDGQISELERLGAGSGPLTHDTELLAGLHHVRARIRGDLAELQHGVDLLAQCTEGPCILQRAEQEQSLHRFDRAQIDVANARALGADPARCTELEADLAWQAGRYDEAIPVLRATPRSAPGWIRLAQLEHDLGHEPEADAAFERAVVATTDPSPLGVAHLELQRGIAKQSLGLVEQALPHFREAVARLPQYVAAQEHLAEALHEAGQDDEATRLYERVVQISTDPEFQHALARQYALAGRAAEAHALDEKARLAYEELLVRYPEAMVWHAAEFFLETGDAARALVLLEQNVKLRPSSESWVSLARAQHAAGNVQAARESIARARAMPVRSKRLDDAAALVR